MDCITTNVHVLSWPMQVHRLDSGEDLGLGILESVHWGKLERNPITSPNATKWVWTMCQTSDVWLTRFSLYVGTWVLIVMVSHNQPCSGETESLNQKWILTPKSWPEAFPKFKLAPTYHQPKPNSFQNNNDNRNKRRDSTGSVSGCGYLYGWHQQAPHQNRVWKADGNPEGPLHCLSNIVRLKTSAPRSRSTLPAVPKSGSARWILDKCFRLWLNGTGQDGRWWWPWAALPHPLSESFHDDLIWWDPPFDVRKVGLQNRQCHQLSWSDTGTVSVGAVLNSLLWTKWKMPIP